MRKLLVEIVADVWYELGDAIVFMVACLLAPFAFAVFILGMHLLARLAH